VPPQQAIVFEEERSMLKTRRFESALFVLMGGLVLAGTMGQSCFFPDTGPSTVDVELVNNTTVVVDPFLYADPDIITVPADVVIPANLVDIGGPLNPGEVATVTFDCFDAGTLLADADALLPGGAIVSENIVILNQEDLFFCGDVVTFTFETDVGGAFFITADVNGVPVTP
jgi:hypothetical protein